MENPSLDRKSLPSQPEPDSDLEADSMPRRRPFGVTLLLLLVLSLSAWGLLRLAAALRWWELLYDKEARLSPLYLSLTGAVWALAGFVLLWNIWSVKRWASLVVVVAVLLWLLEYWIERIFFQAQRPNLEFAIAASLLILAITAISAFNRKTKNYLIKSEEHEQPEEHSASA